MGAECPFWRGAARDRATDRRRIFAEIGDGSAVTDGLKLAAYTGLAPGHPPVRHHPGL